MFDIIVDDGNDVPTAINLTNLNESDNAFFDLDVDEHATGTMLGYVSVDDQDDPRHSHGQHKWKVDEDNEDNFEIVEMNGRQVLKLKDDAMIDFEAEGGDSITLVVTATDGGGAAKEQTIQVEVNDMNDPVVVANEPGSWWVTINGELDPETVAEGALLDFSLETEIEREVGGEVDTKPLFTDQDAADATIPDPSDSTMSLMIGKLTYAFVSGAPDWLEIDADTGRIYSKAEKRTMSCRRVASIPSRLAPLMVPVHLKRLRSSWRWLFPTLTMTTTTKRRSKAPEAWISTRIPWREPSLPPSPLRMKTSPIWLDSTPGVM